MIKNSNNSRNSSNSSKILKKDIKHMWLENFDDTYEYVKYYFKYRFRFSNFLYISEKNSGELLSGMHMNPYKISFFNCFLKGRYVVAVATKSEYRKKGLFNKLILEAFEKYKDESDILFLHPAVENFYEKYLFAPTHTLLKYEISLETLANTIKNIDKNRCSINNNNNSSNNSSDVNNDFKKNNLLLERVTDFNLKTYLKVYNYFSKSFSSFIKKGIITVKNNLREITLENGEIYICEKGMGSFAYTYMDKTLTIKHLFFKDENTLLSILKFVNSLITEKYASSLDKNSLNNFNNLSSLSIQKELEKIVFLTSPKYNLDNFFKKKVESKYILSRILNLESVLESFFEKHKRFSKFLSPTSLFNNAVSFNTLEKKYYVIEISDNFIESNNLTIFFNMKNKTYAIKKGSLKLDTQDKNLDINKIIYLKHFLHFEISEFTSILFGEEKIEKKHPLNEFFSCERGFIHEDV